MESLTPKENNNSGCTVENWKTNKHIFFLQFICSQNRSHHLYMQLYMLSISVNHILSLQAVTTENRKKKKIQLALTSNSFVLRRSCNDSVVETIFQGRFNFINYGVVPFLSTLPCLAHDTPSSLFN